MLEGGLTVPGGLGLGHPELDALELAPKAAGVLLGVGHAVTGGHQIELSGSYDLLRAQAVAVEDLAADEPGDRLEPHVRVGADVDAVLPLTGTGPM